MFVVFYLQAFLNPLQALFNCLVYKRWGKGTERVILPWKRNGEHKEDLLASTINDNESLPLLQGSRTSINVYTKERS